ncbi:MAG: DUF1206 domain-containing protein [Pseudomonas sp.]|uniref:DUF1206 domain-containing protein n=1 Tax=Pseudomonas sp. TaxID=306 RepID=UPI003399CB29
MQVSPAVTGLARSGYAARGLVYLIVGCFAIAAATGSEHTVDAKGALRTLLEQPSGEILLGLMLVGLLSFSAWRLAQAIGDSDCHGHELKGLVVRGGLLASAGVHLMLALFTARLLFKDLGAEKNAGSGQDALQGLLGWDHSNLLLYAVALVPAGVGIAHLVKSWTADFVRYFQADERVMRWVRPVARTGLLARGCVFLVIAALLVAGSRRYKPTDPPGLQEVFAALQALPAGSALLLAIGVGLLAFACYSVAQALWRRIDLAAVTPGTL